MDIGMLLGLQEFRSGGGGFLADFFAKMTFLGELNTVLVIMALLYWCVSKELGTYLLMGWSGNRLVNGVLKVTACAYRPWIRDPMIEPYGDAKTTATGYSFPSGHSMNAASVYGGGALRKGAPLALRIVLLVTVILVAFSRMYLGVHTPQDVLTGAVLGLLVMGLTGRLMRWIDAHPDKDWIVAFVGIELAVGVALYAALKTYPRDFDESGKLLVDGAKMANDTFKGVSWSMAFLVGWLLERRLVRFSTDVPVPVKLTRAAVGLFLYYAVSIILVPRIKAWIPGTEGTFVSCFIQMFYISFLFPLCMKHVPSMRG
ncbi:MAG: phosphatase PAP2 family protein [Clostridia bacterium]|nr:phosphatase PAP2 family protein [Clostridia bacterium]